MHFPSILVASGLLVSTASAQLRMVNREAAMDESYGPSAAWRRDGLDKCAQALKDKVDGKKKRDVSTNPSHINARVPWGHGKTDVMQGEGKNGKGDDELVSTGFSCCIGVAVTIEFDKDDQDDDDIKEWPDRFLGHIMVQGYGWSDIEKDVKEARKKKVKKIEAEMLVVNSQSLLASKKYKDLNKQEYAEAQDRDNKDYEKKVKELVGFDPKVHSHDIDEDWFVQIKKNKKINIKKGSKPGIFD